METETIARARRLEAAGEPDAASFRAANPENPLPLLLVVLDQVPGGSVGRWTALLAGATRVGIAVVLLGDGPVAKGRLVADAGRVVTAVDVLPLAEHLAGAHLFGLRRDEAVELLAPVIESHADEAAHDGAEDGDTVTVEGPAGQDLGPSLQAFPRGEAWPGPGPAPEGATRPLEVRVLGPYRVSAWGEPVATGLRGRARALLAWYLLRPEGATSDAAVDALWPGTRPGDVQRQFWPRLATCAAGSAARPTNSSMCSKRPASTTGPLRPR